MLGKEAGKPIGMIKLSAEHEISSKMESVVAASDSSNDDDVDGAFDQLQKKVRVSSTANAKSEHGAYSVRAPVVKDSQHVPSDFNDFLDSIWGDLPQVSGKKLKKRNTEEESGGEGGDMPAAFLSCRPATFIK